jgi:hypothetical protein
VLLSCSYLGKANYYHSFNRVGAIPGTLQHRFDSQ